MSVAAHLAGQENASESILDHPVHPVSKQEAVGKVVQRALSGRRGAYVCLTNVHTTVASQDNPELRGAAENAFLSVPDGIPLVWELRRRGHSGTEKVTGIEYLPMVAAAGRRVGLRHFFYGGGTGVAAAAAEKLIRTVPGTRVVGSMAPPYAPIDDWPLDELQARLKSTDPHILWVGLGAPKQEIWMARMAEVLNVPVMVGVGACFDFLAGNKRSAPSYLRHVGLEWAYRLVCEPRRLWRRYLIGNSTFLYLMMRATLRGGERTTGRKAP